MNALTAWQKFHEIADSNCGPSSDPAKLRDLSVVCGSDWGVTAGLTPRQCGSAAHIAAAGYRAMERRWGADPTCGLRIS